MLKDITLGQYFPGNSFIHRLDPRTKIVFVLAYIVVLFAAKTVLTYLLLIVILALAIAVSKIPFSTMLRGLKPLALIIVFTAFANTFYSREGRELLSFCIFTITDSGLLRALQMILRIMMLMLSTFLVTYTTTPMQLTDGLELLLSPMKKLKVPVHDFAMMMSIALRFIPTLTEEADKIMSAQKARGADFETGKLLDRAKALLPLLIPLFVSSFRRADDLATAMEARCYNGGEGRTQMKKLSLKASDGIVMASSLILVAGVFSLMRFGI